MEQSVYKKQKTEMTKLNVEGFKAYDIRGEVPEVLNNTVAYAIGRAFSVFSGARSVVVGHDCRFAGELFAETTAKVFADSGVKVYLAKGFVTTPTVNTPNSRAA